MQLKITFKSTKNDLLLFFWAFFCSCVHLWIIHNHLEIRVDTQWASSTCLKYLTFSTDKRAPTEQGCKALSPKSTEHGLGLAFHNACLIQKDFNKAPNQITNILSKKKQNSKIYTHFVQWVKHYCTYRNVWVIQCLPALWV